MEVFEGADSECANQRTVLQFTNHLIKKKPKFSVLKHFILLYARNMHYNRKVERFSYIIPTYMLYVCLYKYIKRFTRAAHIILSIVFELKFYGPKNCFVCAEKCIPKTLT